MIYSSPGFLFFMNTMEFEKDLSIFLLYHFGYSKRYFYILYRKRFSIPYIFLFIQLFHSPNFYSETAFEELPRFSYFFPLASLNFCLVERKWPCVFVIIFIWKCYSNFFAWLNFIYLFIFTSKIVHGFLFFLIRW